MNINLLNVTKHKIAKEIFAVVFTQLLCSRRMSINYSPVAPYYMQAFIISHIPSWEQLQRPALAQQRGLSGAMNCGSTLLNMHEHMHTLISRYGICQYEPLCLIIRSTGSTGKNEKRAADGRMLAWCSQLWVLGDITPFDRSLISYMFSPKVFW